MDLIDTHCHLDLPDFDRDRSRVIDSCLKSGIKALIMPGVIPTGWERLLLLCEQYRALYGAPGLHPCFLEGQDLSVLNLLESILKNSKNVVAIGEVGLDFFIKDHDEGQQRQFFLEQARLAEKSDLPLILHVRRAHDQVTSILKKIRFSRRGVVHCYSGSLQQAGNYLDLGFKLGIGGVVTYERSTRLRKIVGKLPLDSFLLETDAPDIPLSGKEGERNSPENLANILNAFVELRTESDKEIVFQLYQNTLDLFPGLML